MIPIPPRIKKLARIRDADYDKYHDMLENNAPHIETIINPEVEVVKNIDNLMSVPGAVDVGEFAQGRVKFVGINLDKDTELAGTRLMDLPSKTGKRILIAAVVRDERLIIPRGDDILMPGDLIYIIAEETNLLDTLSVFNKKAEPVRRVLIVGGGRIGLRLAKILEKKSIKTKIVEKCPATCDALAEKLDKTVVLCGDGSDQSLLAEENVKSMDVIVTLTDEEETNILTSLMCKKMGARKVITKISKFSYFDLMSAIGMEQVVNLRLSAINSILRYIRKGKVLSSRSLRGEEAEVMEAVAPDSSDIVGKPLKNIKMPKGSLVTTIIRNEEVIIPSGESMIQPEDRIIIFAMREAISKIEKIIEAKLEH
ncbi:Trk system potassium transporter TrkA [Desulfobacterales bacterium HSG16]|nr:Trk system potassium transporter TrkA [Desulfobacterales bacterium HSG16]